MADDQQLKGTVTYTEHDGRDLLQQAYDECYNRSLDNTLDQSVRTKCTDTAYELSKVIGAIAQKQFSDASGDFQSSADKLKQAVADVRKQLDSLNAAANKAKAIVEVAKLLDDMLVIAAGIAKSFA